MDEKGTQNGTLSPRERARERGSNKLLRHAKAMRTQASDAERLLWKHLRARRLHGYKFRRQVVIEPYIVDFVCFEAKLIVEADGGQHMDQQRYDADRTEKLKSMGYTVLRFWNHEILGEIDSVLTKIVSDIVNSPLPNPLPRGEGESF
jgi:very-short-patch-repair endonuclease